MVEPRFSGTEWRNGDYLLECPAVEQEQIEQENWQKNKRAIAESLCPLKFSS